MNTYIKYFGLGIFVLGFFIFVGSLTVNDYMLSEQVIKNQGQGEKYDALLESSKSMQGVAYASNISFIHDLKAVINNANFSIIAKYSIPLDVADKIASVSFDGDQYVYKKDIIDEVIPAIEEVSSERNKSLKDYTGWLEGKSFSTPDELTQQINNSIQSINNAISYQKAFDSYNSKNLLFSMTKASSQGLLKGNIKLWFFMSFGFMIIGAFAYFYGTYSKVPAGIKNNQIFMDAITSKGWLGVTLGSFMIAFYLFLYFYPEYLTNWVLLVDPISYKLNGGPASPQSATDALVRVDKERPPDLCVSYRRLGFGCSQKCKCAQR